MSYEQPSGSESGKNWTRRPGSDQTHSGAAEDIAGFMEQMKGSGTEALKAVGREAQQAAADQKEAGAKRLSAVARAIERAAAELDSEMPATAKYVRRTAAQVDDLSHSLSERSFDDIADAFARFARKQPAMVLGAGVLAGFALTRFLRGVASSHREEDMHPTSSSFRSKPPHEPSEPSHTHEAPTLQPAGEP